MMPGKWTWIFVISTDKGVFGFLWKKVRNFLTYYILGVWCRGLLCDRYFAVLLGDI